MVRDSKDYCYYIFEMKKSYKFGFKIGFLNEKDKIEILCALGAFDDEETAEIAANAFISGMTFLKEVSQ